MKLLRVLVLVALPLYCFAGSGCPLLEQAVDKTVSPEVSIPEYLSFLQPYAQTPEERRALAEMKRCFLNQSNETLTNFATMMHVIYSSKFCEAY